MEAKLIIYSPAWDTYLSKVIYPISPQFQGCLPADCPIKYILPNSSEQDFKGRYQCLTCRNPVTPKRGKKKSWHFAHYAGNACETMDIKCVENGESDTHMFAKYILCEFLQHGYALTIDGSTCYNKYCSSTRDTISIEHKPRDIVKTEYTLPNKTGRADIAVIREGEIRYIFEICKTNKTAQRPGEWYEIDAEEILSKLDEMRRGDHVSFQDIRPYNCGQCPVSDIVPEIEVMDNNCDRDMCAKELDSPDFSPDEDCKGLCLEQMDSGYVAIDTSCCEPISCSQCAIGYPLWLLDQYAGVCMSCDINNYGRGTREKYLPCDKQFFPEVYRAFYIMEMIEFTDDLVEITGDILSGLAPGNRHIFHAWKSWIRDKMSRYIMNFGKYAGRKLCDIPSGYINWMVRDCENLPEELMYHISIIDRFHKGELDIYYNHKGKHTIGLLIYRYNKLNGTNISPQEICDHISYHKGYRGNS